MLPSCIDQGRESVLDVGGSVIRGGRALVSVNSNVCSKKKVMNANKKSKQSVLHFLSEEGEADPAIGPGLILFGQAVERLDLSEREIERGVFGWRDDQLSGGRVVEWLPGRTIYFLWKSLQPSMIDVNRTF
jgi:hypothetical protein